MEHNFKEQAEEKMHKAFESLTHDFNLIRSGKANTAIFDRIAIEYYGSMTPLSQTAAISAPEARLIVITPYDKNLLNAIEKAILSSDLSLNPNNDGKVIRINIPPLTEERRKTLAKQAKTEAEKHRVSTRNARRDVLEAMKKAALPEDEEKRLREEIQKLTDFYIKKIDEALIAKEKEIMEV